MLDNVQAQENSANLGYAFVMNVRSLGDASSYTLAPGHDLTKANTEQIAKIKSILTDFSGIRGIAPFHLWEAELPLSRHGAVHYLRDESQWRYFVVNFVGTNEVVGALQTSFDLANSELEIGFTVMHMAGGGTGMGWHPDRMFHVLDTAGHTDSFLVDVSAEIIEEVISIRSQLRAYNHPSLNIRGFAAQLGEMKSIPHISPLRFLGYFAILESLITHAPKASDPSDSITRQVKNKVALLNNRWARKIDYSPFGGAKPDAIWNKMYDYRSRLAHGASASISGDLALLRNRDTALTLLKAVVKAVIRLALAEPQLLIDLKEC